MRRLRGENVMLMSWNPSLESNRKRRMRRMKQQAGMTLLEIMVVIILVGLLGTVVGVAVIRQFQTGKVGIAKTQVCKLQAAVKQYHLQKNKYPSNSEGLQALLSARIWGSKKIPKDPWGRDYAYRFPGTSDPTRPDIYSLGSDGREGGTDDTTKDIRCEQ
jgi:general secretion pathway protein G